MFTGTASVPQRPPAAEGQSCGWPQDSVSRSMLPLCTASPGPVPCLPAGVAVMLRDGGVGVIPAIPAALSF